VNQPSPLFSRALTVIAAAVLAFDGAALAALGWWGHRPMLALIGVVFFVSSGLVLLYWRWYRKRLKDIESAQRALAEEAREIQRVLRER
jgi:membrane protein implicated in regulation of membrane protease activity